MLLCVIPTRVVGVLAVAVLVRLTAAAPAQEAAKPWADAATGVKLIDPPKWYAFSGKDLETGQVEQDVAGNLRRLWLKDRFVAIALLVESTPEPRLPIVSFDATVHRIFKDARVEIKEKEVRVIAGKKAGSCVLSGPGVGIGLSKEGTMKTFVHLVGIPREKDVVILVLSADEAGLERAERDFANLLKSLEISGKQTREQAAVKAVEKTDEDEIDRDAKAALARADKLRAGGKYAEALDLYNEIGVKYAARDAGKMANERARQLREDPDVQARLSQQRNEAKEVAAHEQGDKWLKVARQLAEQKKYDLARGYYQKIIDKYPGTKLAQTAQAELDKLPKS